jgi:hypothetical protein
MEGNQPKVTPSKNGKLHKGLKMEECMLRMEMSPKQKSLQAQNPTLGEDANLNILSK